MIKIVLILRKNSILKVTVTKNSPTNMTGSTIITAKNLPREKTVGRVDETNKTISTVKTHTIAKQIMSQKIYLLFQRSKHLYLKKIK